MSIHWGWVPRMTVAGRRRQASMEATRLRNKGRDLQPVVTSGRTIARTFWGKAWCTNLERYSDYANRLPRGRSYLRNGAVLHLEIGDGEVRALVSGSSLYEVSIAIVGLSAARWTALRRDSSGAIDSMIELLQGRLSTSVMERMSREGDGLFPSPRELAFRCSCPDSASMCKHVAAVLYGVGTRLDSQPELLFRLRKVDAQELISTVDAGAGLVAHSPNSNRELVDVDLSELFGLPMSTDGAGGVGDDVPPAPRRSAARPPKMRAGVTRDHP